MKSEIIERRLERYVNESVLIDSSEPSRKIQLTQSAGNFLYLMIKSIKAKRILQIGTFGGNNALWLGSAASYTGGLVVALQCEPKKSTIAKLNFKTANLLKSIQLIDENLESAIRNFRAPFDLMFLDSYVEDYLHYFKLAYSKIRPGGIIITDKAVSHYDELEEYMDYICRITDLESTLAPIGKGLIISYKKQK